VTDNENQCQQCGGTVRLEYRIGFEQGRPMDLRVDPPTFLKICPGHPIESSVSDWKHLSNQQKYSLNKLQERMKAHFAAEVKAFFEKYPELTLEYNFTIDAFLRGHEVGQ